MHFVAKKLSGIHNPMLSLVGASIFVFNSFISLQVSEGHTWILSFAYIPWVYYFFESYVTANKQYHLIGSAAGITLMIYEGGIYPVPLLILFLGCYSALQWICYSDRTYLAGLIKIGILSLLLSAAKIVPLLDYMMVYPRHALHYERIPFSALLPIFLGRNQTLGSKLFEGQRYGWHEYGCYLGCFLLLIICISIAHTLKHRRTERSSICILFCLIVFFSFFLGGNFYGLAPYALLKKLPIFSSTHVTGRFLIIITFASSLLVLNYLGWKGRAMKHMAKKKATIMTLGITIGIAVILFDLFRVNTETFAQAFTINPSEIRYFTDEFETPHQYHYVSRLPRYGAYSSMYPALRMNLATIRGYEFLSPAHGFVRGRELVFSSNKRVRIRNIVFTPNRIVFDAHVPSRSVVHLNQNYVRGWKTSIRNLEVRDVQRKPTVVMDPGYYSNVCFYFFPNSIYIGIILTALGIIVCVLLVSNRNRFFGASTGSRRAAKPPPFSNP